MARQYHVEVTYLGVPTHAEIYWHDNDTIEFITLPQIIGADSLADRAHLIATVIALMKKDSINVVEFSKEP